jgi:hypothetical protein
MTQSRNLQQFTLENRWSPPSGNNLDKRSTSHACTCGTLLETSLSCNKKLLQGCAEAVDDGSSLWKDKEK